MVAGVLVVLVCALAVWSVAAASAHDHLHHGGHTHVTG